MGAGDVIIDGGNSYYRDDIERAERLSARGIHYVDVGTSGGVHGLERGFCLMIGGDDRGRRTARTHLPQHRPRSGAAARTPGRAGEPSPAEQGYLHCGPHGAGHFVKMVHNGIEYGLMAAYAEGLNILHKANVGITVQAGERRERAAPRPRVLPVRPRHARGRRGVAAGQRGRLLAARPHRGERCCARRSWRTSAGRVSDSGEGRWTVLAAVDEGVPAHVLTAALYERFSSRGEADFADRLLSAMRREFGGHAELPAGG